MPIFQTLADCRAHGSFELPTYTQAEHVTLQVLAFTRRGRVARQVVDHWQASIYKQGEFEKGREGTIVPLRTFLRIARRHLLNNP